MEDLAAKILIGLIVGVTSAWVTVRLSIGKFRSEKWWELKVKAYTEVIEAFHHSKSFNEKHIKAEMAGRELSGEYEETIMKNSVNAHREIDKYINTGSFVFSDTFYARLKKYKKESDSIDRNEHSWTSYLIEDLEVTENCLDDLIELAKKDLKR